MKNKKLLYGMIITAVLIIVLLWAVFGMKIRINDGKVQVEYSLIIPYAYTLYDDYAVLERYNGSKENVVIPEKLWGKPVTVVGYGCFAKNNAIKKVSLNKSIEMLDIRAFAQCENLIEVNGGVNVKKIDSTAFTICKKLEKVEIGNKLEFIGSGAFSTCEALKAIDSQENLVYIGDAAFAYSGLEEFVFNRDAQVGNGVFDESAWIENQSEEYIIYGDGALIGYNGDDDKIMIPDTVKTLNGGCLTGLVRNEIYIPESVMVIHDFTFMDCEDVRVYIPASVEQLGSEDGGYEPENPIMNDDVTMTIITTYNSAAHQYAKENNISCEIVEGW